MADYKTPQWLLPNEKNLAYPASGDEITGSGLSEDRHSLYSMEFDGVDDYIKVDGLSNVLTNQDFTLSLWFKGTGQTTTADSSNMLFSAHGSGTSNILRIGIAKSSGGIYFAATGSSGSVVGSADYDDSNWYHLVITKPYVSGGAAGTVYINGSSIGNTEVFNIDFSSAINYSIGQEYDPTLSPGDFFKGNIDEVAIWNKILNNDEIVALSTANAPANLMALSAKPIAYYPLGEQAQMGYSNWNFPNGSLQSHVVDFDGINDYIQLSSPMSTSGTDWSISFWFKTSQSGGNKIFVGQTGSIYFGNNWGRLTFYSSDNSFDITSTLTINDGNWHNGVFTYNYTSGSWSLYIDNVLDTNQTATTGVNIPLWNFFGARSSSQYFADCELSNIAMWNSDQSANIANIYNNGSPQSTYTVTPTSWWKLNAADSSYVYPWTMSITGAPDYTSSNDGCYISSGVLKWRDTGTPAAFTDTFDWYSKEITGANTNITISSTGGEWQGESSSIGLRLFYKIDGGSWVQFQEETHTGGYSPTAWTLTAPAAQSSSSSFQLKVVGFGGASSNSYVTLNDITVTADAGTLYTESFTDTDGTGFANGVYTPPPVDWTFIDSSGSNNGASDTLPTSALVTSNLQFESPYSNYSLDFDGVGNYLDLTQQDLGTTNTISLWLNTSSITSDQTVLGEPSNTFKQSVIIGSNIIYIKDVSNDYKGWNLSTSSEFSLNNWHHFGIVRSGSTVTFYIDGVDQGPPDVSSGAFTANTKLRYLAVNYPTNTQFFPGKIDELALWGSALTQAQVIQVYNNGYPNDLTSLSPSQWWRLGEDSYFVSNNVTIPNKITGGLSGTGSGTQTAMLVGEAPGSYANGLGSSLDVFDRIGDAPESTANSVSINMIPSNRHSYPAGYVPTQVDNVYSMDFDGTNDYVNAGNDTSLNWGTGNGSVSCWFKTTQVVTGAVDLVINGGFSTGGKAYLLYLDGNEKVGFYLDDNASPTTPAQSSGSVADGNWHHVVGVRESGNIKLYLDGSLVSTQTDTTGNIDSTDPLIIGAGMNASTGVVGNFYDGKIDEVAIFDYALSARQIKQDIYNGTTTGKTADLNNISNLTAPIAWYRMGD